MLSSGKKRWTWQGGVVGISPIQAGTFEMIVSFVTMAIGYVLGQLWSQVERDVDNNSSSSSNDDGATTAAARPISRSTTTRARPTNISTTHTAGINNPGTKMMMTRNQHDDDYDYEDDRFSTTMVISTILLMMDPTLAGASLLGLLRIMSFREVVAAPVDDESGTQAPSLMMMTMMICIAM
jgi:hypothetical protein